MGRYEIERLPPWDYIRFVAALKTVARDMGEDFPLLNEEWKRIADLIVDVAKKGMVDDQVFKLQG